VKPRDFLYRRAVKNDPVALDPRDLCTVLTRYDDDAIVSVNLSNQAVADCGCL
jgi:hypothetical protein